MDVLNPVSTIMTTDLITVSPNDPITTVKTIFDKNRIHHIPVIDQGKLVGIISKTDLLYFLRGVSSIYQDFLNNVNMQQHKVSDLMTKGIAKVGPNDKISVVVEVFKENLFHAVPVVEEERLVGIVTTFDLIKGLSTVKTPA